MSSTFQQYLRMASSIFATVLIGFGINAILNPVGAISFFELPYVHTPPSQKQLIDALLAVYGIRDIFIGVAMYAAAYLGDRKTLGFITIATGGVAIADGVVCKNMVGRGEWNHWGFAPMAVGVGAALIGS